MPVRPARLARRHAEAARASRADAEGPRARSATSAPDGAGRASSATPAGCGRCSSNLRRQRHQVHRQRRRAARRSRRRGATTARRVLHFAVRDTGIGIPAREAARASSSRSPRPTARPRASYGGTGLGLAICAELVDADGRAHLASRARRRRAARSISPRTFGVGRPTCRGRRSRCIAARLPVLVVRRQRASTGASSRACSRVWRMRPALADERPARRSRCSTPAARDRRALSRSCCSTCTMPDMDGFGVAPRGCAAATRACRHDRRHADLGRPPRRRRRVPRDSGIARASDQADPRERDLREAIRRLARPAT